MQGVYETCREIAPYQIEQVELIAGNYRYWFWSDITGEREKKFPLVGKYHIKEGRVVLGAPASKEFHISSINSIDVLLTEESREAWTKDKKLLTKGILVYSGRATLDRKMPPAMSKKALLTDKQLEESVKAYESRYSDQPQPIRDLLRAATSREDGEGATFRIQVEKARAALDSEVVNTLVLLMSSEDEVLASLCVWILECLYLKNEAMEEGPQFAKEKESSSKAVQLLVDAFSRVQNKYALEGVLWTFMGFLGLPKVEFKVIECGVQISLERRPDGLPYWKSSEILDSEVKPHSRFWKNEIGPIAQRCRTWCQTQLKTLDSKAPKRQEK
jgi:hypothetical protein